MKIKDRLALYFTLSSTLIMMVILSAIYFTFLKFLEADFFARLTDRTMVTAKLYLEADEISQDSLNKVRSMYLEKLNGEVIRIYNSKNTAAFIGDDQQYWSNSTINKVRDAGKLRFKDGERQVVGIYYKDNQGDFVIIASAVDQSTHYRLDKLRRIMLIIFVIVVIGLLLSGRWIANKILSPLAHFIEEVKQIKSSNLHFRVHEGKNKDEINLLAQNFNNLMEHLEQAFVLQRTFVANASHELRTPITRMIISAELSLSQEREKQDYRKALSSVLEDAEKMEGIITGLVNLAQTDLEFASSQLSPVRIDETLWTLQNEWKESAALNLRIDMQNLPENERELLIKANPVLLHIALNNIISNAFKFSDNKPVYCLLDMQDTAIELSFTDQGPGIAEDAFTEIFKPFYSATTESRHRGNGMGLYMAHKIITLYKGQISVMSEKGHGTTIKVVFPKL
ncbi:HAMP domain-containing sensor histidine kinase [Pedobacter heparinus]|uniref:histidine kinase n=1 Tax=Pedobacter heparinus (strain ATCC 13125 / DSM 2366 / CIP 104194 / JCM 7457 / NBRC 12017 / NCIMB 9290 / NRRL B-14731 / HIM 762-3) TaxID=485917 RepID=C6XSZ8_PEDHD|nr:ATP-binding protein [Pedobacter heparinus]ACU03559.1 ATP-binding region ATPase domain protein [Pedobacter heparinus DSM 2366]